MASVCRDLGRSGPILSLLIHYAPNVQAQRDPTESHHVSDGTVFSGKSQLLLLSSSGPLLTLRKGRSGLNWHYLRALTSVAVPLPSAQGHRHLFLSLEILAKSYLNLSYLRCLIADSPSNVSLTVCIQPSSFEYRRQTRSIGLDDAIAHDNVSCSTSDLWFAHLTPGTMSFRVHACASTPTGRLT